MSADFLFYFQVTLTGVVIAAASYSFSSVINAPPPKIYPVVGRGGIAAALALWILSGPISLARFGVSLYQRRSPFSNFFIVAVLAALIWAFFLGVLVLELAFQLFFG